MSLFRIGVRGTGIQPYVLGALLARWCRGPTTRVLLNPCPDSIGDQPLLLRPAFHRFHAEIDLTSEDLDNIGCHVATATQIDGDVSLPFERYGLPRDGVEFHQHWLRGRMLGEETDISEYSPSFALARVPQEISCRQAERIPFDTGLSAHAMRYSELLEHRFVQMGGILDGETSEADCELMFDCSEEHSASRWSGRTIAVACPSRIPGMAPHAALDAGRRWLGLSARPGESATEESEFNRLSTAEAERIGDMKELVFSTDPAASTRPGLARKIAVFKACGRIPLEDYEVFAHHEWLAALLSRGFKPARHDRLADVMAPDALLNWLAELRRKLQPSGMTA